jgi:hypothetical protein
VVQLPGARTGAWPAVLKEHLDVLPHWDLRLKLREARRALAWRRWEHAEVARHRAAGTTLPPARVDVVIPTYRRPVMLRKAVRSVLAQTVQDVTVIVVDDGGGGTAGLPDDPRVHVVTLSRNTAVLGVVNNVGLRLGNSPVIALLNDDNTWRPRHLTSTLQAMDDGADLVYAGMQRHEPDGTAVDVLARPFSRGALRSSAFTDSSSLVVRRLPGLHFSRAPRGKQAFPKEDWEFVWRYSRTLTTALAPEITVDYLIHDQSYLTDWSAYWLDRGR